MQAGFLRRLIWVKLLDMQMVIQSNHGLTIYSVWILQILFLVSTGCLLLVSVIFIMLIGIPFFHIIKTASYFFRYLLFYWLLFLVYLFMYIVLVFIYRSYTIQRMMALYVASHYKNSPNDLQLLADAPAHHLFVLLGTLFVYDIIFHSLLLL